MRTMRQSIDLAKADKFPDMTPLPERLYKQFWIDTFVDMDADGDWAVSDSINRHRIWEPVETAVLSSAFAGNPDGVLLDFGCHVGWYTVIARTWGLEVAAWDWSADCIELLRRRNDDHIRTLHGWIDEHFELADEPYELAPDTPGSPIIVKIDIEGAEIHVVRGMSEMFSNHDVHIAMIECSPVFNNSYPGLVNGLVKAGYEAWVLPEKQTPPPVMDDTRRWLRRHCRPLHQVDQRTRDAWVRRQHQFNAIFCLPEVQWG